MSGVPHPLSTLAINSVAPRQTALGEHRFGIQGSCFRRYRPVALVGIPGRTVSLSLGAVLGIRWGWGMGAAWNVGGRGDERGAYPGIQLLYEQRC